MLKIDRAFVAGAIGHEDGEALVRAIHSMVKCRDSGCGAYMPIR